MKKYFFLLLFLNLSVFTFSQVNADFIMTPPNGCSPLAVNFTDQSTGAITNWDWTFGNGNSSTQQNPGAVYITPGNYPVCLTVTDGINSDTFCDTVVVYEDPAINFIADDSTGCSDLSVNFTNLTMTGTGIQSAFWNFGDGNTSNDINPSHTFTPGIYDITLIVTDSSGCIAQGDKLQYISSTPAASVDFSGTNTQSCGIPNVVNFTNTSTNDAGATYTWIFGDGTPNSNLENPTHAYTAFGSYDVKLIVNKNGCTDSITKLNFVNIQAQDADFSANTTSSCIGESVNFTDLSVLTPTAWSWDFGDGSAPSTNQNPSHTYNTAGTYTVVLSTTLTGCDDVETKTNYITVNANPTVNFSANQTDTCSTPFPVDFTSVTSPVMSYDWDFGDGSPNSNIANPTHVYTSAGIFTVNLTVTDANNCSAASNMPDLINVVPPTANFNIDSVLGCSPRTINISDLSTSDNTITDWYWDFGDGTTQNGPQNPVHTYVDTGSFMITLAIADDNGCVDTLQPGAVVNVGQPLMPDFSATPLSACRVDPISFTNLTDSLGISGVQWSWDFGDGGTDNTFEPIYQYGDTGVFEVTLTATHNGCSRSISYPDLITINPPIAVFSTIANCNDYTEISFIDNSIDPETWTWNIAGDTFNTQDVLNYNTTGMPSPLPVTLYVENNTFGCLDSLSLDFTPSLPVVAFEADDSLACAPFDVQFTNNSTFGASYVWDFGDGSTSSATNPSHTYSNNGIYTVKLVVQNTLGCSDSISYTNLITVIGSDPDFTSPDTAGCRVFTTSFVDLSTSVAGPITNWSWDFGDGSPVNNMQNPVHSFSEVGSFNISLTTTDSAGCVNTETKPLYITSTGPLPGFNNTALACVDTDINFNNTSTSLGGTITSFLWNFGDGNTSTLENPTHSYNNPGIYDVSLYLQDNNGCDSTFVVQNAITIDSLVVDFSADSTVGSCTGFIVNFEELATPNPISWSWDFGDGNTSSVANPSTIYSNVGDFDVTLIASNAAGCIDTIVKSDFISVNGPQGTLSVSQASGCIDLDVEFTVISQNSVDQTWDLGDGTVINNSNFTFNHTYTDVNTFFPSVILEDSAGCLIPYYFDTIYTGSISAELDLDANYICTPNSINFADSSSSSPPIISWDWNFGDGNTSNIQHPTNNFTQDGVFDISLIVDNGICADTAQLLQAVVSDSSTQAFFQYTPPAIVCPPVAINFNNNSSADSAITTYNWDFGNGDVSIAQNPGSIIFSDAGLFNISLDIVTEKGCISSFSDSIRINEIPSFSFDFDSIALCRNEDTTISTLQDDANFTWTPSTNLSCVDCSNPTISANSSATYFINAVSEFGCEYNDTLIFIVNELPEISTGNDQKVLEGANVRLSAFSPGITNFEWSPSEDLSCNNCANPEFIATSSVEFTVTIEDEFGCRNTDSTFIEVIEICNGKFLLFPNVFTPNNDGKNDVFKPTSKQNLNADINYFRIFDRWGKLIFETQEITEGWNGLAKSGNYMNNGVYIYTLEIMCQDGNSEIYKGNVTLIR